MLLEGIQTVLVKTRFPENIGMAARACANMGCRPSVWWILSAGIGKRPLPWPPPKGKAFWILCRYVPLWLKPWLPAAWCLEPPPVPGGWRQALLPPRRAAQAVAAALARGEKVSLVFGPEDRGLNNEEIIHCQRLVTIPTDAEASSLNLAQAVLLMLYECANAVRALRVLPAAEKAETSGGRAATAEEQERLMAALKAMLLSLDYLHGDNPDYFMLPWATPVQPRRSQTTRV